MASLDTAPAVNGNIANSPSPIKRKRIEDVTTSQPRSKYVQRDVLEILEKHDTMPSFLQHVFSTNDDINATEPVSKKARLSDQNTSSVSIATKLKATSYASLGEIKADATTVSQELVSSIRVNAGDTDTASAGRPSVDQLKLIHRVQAFEALVKDVVDQEIQYIAAHQDEETGLKTEGNRLPNGHAPEVKDAPASSRAGTVLTLFGNAPTPKQLFSSMQHAAGARSDPVIKNELIVEEMSLPNGLTATNVMPVPSDDAKPGPSFEQAFAPPYSLSSLQPPKTHRRPATRDTPVTWEFKDPVQRNGRKGGYTVQSLTVGDWLSYGGADPESELSSPREKRKLRDRALSSGESTLQPPNKVLVMESMAKEEEALFRKAYSSFAPSYDNTKALVSKEVKNMVWWHKVGDKRFNSTFAIDPALVDQSQLDSTGTEAFAEPPAEEEDFSRLMEDLDELDGMDFDIPEQVRSKTDVDQVLTEVSELLETLASHQRIRNASLASSGTASRTPISPTPTLAAKIGTPDEPAEEELSTYTALRRELAYLILRLPPYAIAKLNGDQLAELAISKIIPLETKDVRGTMEEDQVTRQAKLAALATATSIATLTRPSSSAGQHYNTTAQRTPAIGQAANTRYGQSAHLSARTPSVSQYQRPVASHQQYGTPSGPRASYGQPNQYNRSGPAQQGYGPNNTQQYYQPRPMQQTPGGYGNYTPQYQPSQQRMSYAPQPVPQYQQRSHVHAANAVAYQTSGTAQQNSYPRTASPAKSTGHAAPNQQPSTQQRPNYQLQPQQSNSGRATPTNYTAQSHTPVNGYQPPPAQQRPSPSVAPRPSSTTPQPPLNAPATVHDGPSARTNGHS